MIGSFWRSFGYIFDKTSPHKIDTGANKDTFTIIVLSTDAILSLCGSIIIHVVIPRAITRPWTREREEACLVVLWPLWSLWGREVAGFPAPHRLHHSIQHPRTMACSQSV